MSLPMATGMTAHEVLILFSQALSQAADSEAQASILVRVREAIEHDPSFIPVLYSTILSVAQRSGGVLKRWIADTVEFVVARMAVLSNALSPEQRIHLTLQSLDTILLFLESPEQDIHKLGLQCFATAYPLVFRHACGTGSDPRLWEKASRGKGIALNAFRTGSTGAKTAAAKCVQKIIQSQTRGSLDPRLQNRGDINLAMCPSHHPFMKAQELEAEANKLVEQAFTILYTSPVPDIVSSIASIFTALVKARPALSHLIFGAFTNWTPNSLSALPFVHVRSVEKTLRLALIHLLRSGHGNAYAAQINDALHRQDARMRAAAEAEARRKDEEASLKRQRIAEDAGRAGVIAGQQMQDPAAKRRKLDNDGTMAPSPTPPPGPMQPPSLAAGPPNPYGLTRNDLMPLIDAFRNASGSAPMPGIADFDITALPVSLILELVIANLQVLSEEALQSAIERARRSLPPPALAADGDGSAVAIGGSQAREGSAPAVKVEEVAALDPLNLELDEDDLEGRALAAQIQEKQHAADLAAAEAEVEAALLGRGGSRERSGTVESTGADAISRQASVEPQISAAISSNAKLLNANSRLKSRLMHAAIGRICAVGISSAANIQAGGGDKDLWIQLISRLVTRGLPTQAQLEAAGTEQTEENADSKQSSNYEAVRKEKNAIRKQIFDFVTADLAGRMELARLWLNEEWYTRDDSAPSDAQPYDLWLRQLLDFVANSAQEKGSSFTHFFVDLPQIPKKELLRLVKMCTDPAAMKVGFMTLRDLATLRPPLRSDAMDVLLSLSTHAERATRAAAILTIKRWVPDTQPLGQMGLDFALHLLQRLESPPEEPKAEALDQERKQADGEDMDLGNEDPQQDPVADMARVEHGQVVDDFPYPKTELLVAQHLELLLGLVTKAPDLLDELFKAYPRMSDFVKESLQTLFTPLVRSLGAANPKILAIVQETPAGSEDLVLRILTILTERGKLPGPLASAIKATAQERDLSPRFLVPIIADFDKAEIVKHLPKIVSLLNGKPAERDLVRSVFQSVVTTPPQNFGFSSTNVPRVRQSELLTPVELMALLHQSEKEIGLKQSIEAISICFSMTEAFRPEVLGAFMQQIVDEATLPTLFLRTVIQAVTTYKSLQPYVSNTLLSRLITKKIWTMPQLWQGFIRCAKVIAPTSFGAILQLPREQIKELVNRQPDLREGLKEYVNKKAGTNKSRIAGLLEVLDAT